MGNPLSILVVSDIHYASALEQERRNHESGVIPNPLLRTAVRCYRKYVWLRDPFAHNHLLDDLLARPEEPDLVVANGDYSVDSAFIGVSDPAACESARFCVGALRDRFGSRLHLVMGDHELGKMSLFGGKGGMRLASLEAARSELGLATAWKVERGRHVFIGVTSSLLALQVYEPETLLEERPGWCEARERHLAEVRGLFEGLDPRQRVILFCHDPTALPALAREPAVAERLGQVERTIIGHLHSRLILWKSQMLAGMPPIRFLGNSIRRMSEALDEARVWRRFRVILCPALAGIELLKDGGFLRGTIPGEAGPVGFEVVRMPWRIPA